MVASDLHYLTKEFYDNGEYFNNLVDNADGKLMHYSEELVSAFAEEVIEKSPDYLILSGDLSFNGERKSHEALISRLSEIERHGTSVLVIPGNHDFYDYQAASFHGDSYQNEENTRYDWFASHYAPFGYDEAEFKDEKTFSYLYPLDDLHYVLMLDSNSVGSGYLPWYTINWMKSSLKTLKARGKQVISVTHQSVLMHNPLFTYNYMLEDYQDIKDILVSNDVKVNLAGHYHMQNIANDGSFYEILTSALSINPVQYGWIDLDGSSFSYASQALDVSSYAKRHELRDSNLLDFSSYALSYFSDISTKKMRSSLTSQDTYSEDEITAMVDFISKCNVAYFSGDFLDYASLDGYDLWMKANDNLKAYLKTMFASFDSGIDHHKLKIEL